MEVIIGVEDADGGLCGVNNVSLGVRFLSICGWDLRCREMCSHAYSVLVCKLLLRAAMEERLLDKMMVAAFALYLLKFCGIVVLNGRDLPPWESRVWLHVVD